MSSQPSRRRKPFETWRKIMLLGAVILLLAAIAQAAIETMPGILYTFFNAVGYVALALGFGSFMRARRAASEQAPKPPGYSPTDKT